MTNDSLSLTFIALAGDFCKTIQNTTSISRDEFIDTMLRLLPRLYVAMNSYSKNSEPEMDIIGNYVDEDHYNQARQAVATLMGEDDIFLETFMEDMKYSDTPIAASISESIADIYQDMLNFTMTVRDSEGALTSPALDDMHENFTLYWSKTLCNVLRPLNALKYNP